jgi:predicted TIM-barrel fold metal-dependent hydrolase
MCFPSFPGFSGRLFAAADDKELALDVVRAYNDWHVDEWCGAYPGRFIPMSLPVLWDAELAAEEVRRMARKGVHSVTFTENPATLGYPSFHDASWDPFWTALCDEGVVLSIHLGSSGQLAVTAADAPVDVMITLQPMNIVQAAADILFSPLITEYPGVQIALSEGGIGWIPYFLERIDHTYKVHKAWTFADFGGKLPSEVFMERMILCFIEDDFGARQAREIGVDRICMETDYPHSDAVWPNAPERMMEAFAPTDLSDDEINRITHLNAMKFFQYDPFKIRPREKCTAGALRAEAEGHDVSIVAKGRRVERDAPTKVAVFGGTRA